MSSNRIEYFDFLRGIAIIFVVAIHSFTPFSISESNTLNYHLAIIWRQIIGCAVPIFLAISGYFMSSKYFKTQHDFHLFLKKQIRRVYLPMLVWSIPFFIYSLFNGVNILKSFVFLLIGGFSVYYFIVLIIQYYILLPSLQSLSNIIGSGKMVLYSSLICLICMVALFILTKVLDYSFPLVAYAGLFPVWIVFFVTGIYLGKNKIKISRNKLLILTFLGLIISIFETYLTISYTGRFTGLGIKTGAFIYSFTVILFLFSLDTNMSFNSTLWRGIVYIGNISFGIYLIHMYFLIYLVRPIINYLPTNNWAIDQFLIITITLGLCVTMIDVSKKINFNFAKKYFGF